MNRLQFNCGKSGVKLGIWIFFGLVALATLKGAVGSYLRNKGSFELVVSVICVVGLIAVGYMVRSYFRFKSVLLEVVITGNVFSIANKDEHGNIIQETHVDLNKIHRAWILDKRLGYKIVIVLTDSKSTEQVINTVPTQMFDIDKKDAMAILTFIYENNPSVKIGYM